MAAERNGILEIIGGAAGVAAGALAVAGTFGALTPLEVSLAKVLESAGVGMALTGIGTIVAGDPIKGFATTTRNSIAPWGVLYGRVRTGGSLIILEQEER
jgi:hypothetical protein